MVSEITAFHQVEDEVESVSVLKGKMHVDDERTAELTQEDSLIHDALDALFGHHSTVNLCVH